MSKLLTVKSSLNEQGVSNLLLNTLADLLKQKFNGQLTEVQRNLNNQPLPLLTPHTITSIRTGEANSEQQQQTLALSNELIDELKAANYIAISFPRYNFQAPAGLKNYFDYVARAKVSFEYTAQGPKGLLPDVPVFAIITSGGNYGDIDSDLYAKWIKQILGFLGYTKIYLIKADGTAIDKQVAIDTATQQLTSIVNSL